MTTQEIIDKLRPTFSQEGIELEVLGQEGPNLNVRAKRVASGIPVAFLLKAVAGTFRRYHDEIKEVVLVDYDPGDEKFATAQPNPDFEKVLRHGVTATKKKSFAETGPHQIPALDLSSCNRQTAVRALETARKIWNAPGVFAIDGLENEAVRRAFDKWKHHQDCLALEIVASPGQRVLVLKEAPELPRTLELARKTEFDLNRQTWMPAKIILMNEQTDGP